MSIEIKMENGFPTHITPTAHWIEKALDKFKHWEYQCSNCGATYQDNYDAYIDVENFNYCPNCGAKIEVE